MGQQAKYRKYFKVFPHRSLPKKSKNQLVQNGVPSSCGTISFFSMELKGSLTGRHEQGEQLYVD